MVRIEPTKTKTIWNVPVLSIESERKAWKPCEPATESWDRRYRSSPRYIGPFRVGRAEWSMLFYFRSWKTSSPSYPAPWKTGRLSNWLCVCTVQLVVRASSRLYRGENVGSLSKRSGTHSHRVSCLSIAPLFLVAVGPRPSRSPVVFQFLCFISLFKHFEIY